MSDSLATPWTVAHQAPLSKGFPRQEYYFLLPGIFATQGSYPGLLHWQAGSLPLSHQGHPIGYCLYLEVWSFYLRLTLSCLERAVCLKDIQITVSRRYIYVCVYIYNIPKYVAKDEECNYSAVTPT